MFLAAYREDPGQLDNAIIFSTIEILAFLRITLFFLGVCLGFIAELNVIFTRFV